MTETRNISGQDIVEYWQYVKLHQSCKERDMDIAVLSMYSEVDILPKFTGLPETQITSIFHKQVSIFPLTLDTILLNFIEYLSGTFTHQVKGIISFLDVKEYTNAAVKPISYKGKNPIDNWLDSDSLNEPNFTYIIRYAFTEIN